MPNEIFTLRRELHNSARLATNNLRAVLHHLQGREQLEFALAVAGAGGHFVIQAVHKFQFSAKVGNFLSLFWQIPQLLFYGKMYFCSSA